MIGDGLGGYTSTPGQSPGLPLRTWASGQGLRGCPPDACRPGTRLIVLAMTLLSGEWLSGQIPVHQARRIPLERRLAMCLEMPGNAMVVGRGSWVDGDAKLRLFPTTQCPSHTPSHSHLASDHSSSGLCRVSSTGASMPVAGFNNRACLLVSLLAGTSDTPRATAKVSCGRAEADVVLLSSLYRAGTLDVALSRKRVGWSKTSLSFLSSLSFLYFPVFPPPLHDPSIVDPPLADRIAVSVLFLSTCRRHPCPWLAP